MAGKHIDNYVRPMLTTDIVLFGVVGERLSTLLIRRKRDPFAGRWAFPGGFVDEYEPPERAARRELKEETGVDLDSSELRLFGVFGQRGRDPRGWTVTASYYAILDVSPLSAVAGDDAAAVAWKPVDRTGPLAFDHRPMLKAALSAMRFAIYTTPVVQSLLEPEFQRTDLTRIYHVLDPACPSPSDLIRRLTANCVIRRLEKGRFRLIADHRLT